MNLDNLKCITSSNDTFLKFAILDLIMIICACARIPMHLILLSLIKQICSYVAIHIKDLITTTSLPVSLWKATKVLSAFLPHKNNRYASSEQKLCLCEERKNCRYTCRTDCLFLLFLCKTNRVELLPMSQIPSHYSSASK